MLHPPVLRQQPRQHVPRVARRLALRVSQLVHDQPQQLPLLLRPMQQQLKRRLRRPLFDELKVVRRQRLEPFHERRILPLEPVLKLPHDQTPIQRLCVLRKRLQILLIEIPQLPVRRQQDVLPQLHHRVQRRAHHRPRPAPLPDHPDKRLERLQMRNRMFLHQHRHRRHLIRRRTPLLGLLQPRKRVVRRLGRVPGRNNRLHVQQARRPRPKTLQKLCIDDTRRRLCRPTPCRRLWHQLVPHPLLPRPEHTLQLVSILRNRRQLGHGEIVRLVPRQHRLLSTIPIGVAAAVTAAVLVGEINILFRSRSRSRSRLVPPETAPHTLLRLARSKVVKRSSPRASPKPQTGSKRPHLVQQRTRILHLARTRTRSLPVKPVRIAPRHQHLVVVRRQKKLVVVPRERIAQGTLAPLLVLLRLVLRDSRLCRDRLRALRALCLLHRRPRRALLLCIRSWRHCMGQNASTVCSSLPSGSTCDHLGRMNVYTTPNRTQTH